MASSGGITETLYSTEFQPSNFGFAGALYSGMLTASAILKRDAMIHLVNLHKKLKAGKKSKIA